MGVTLTEYERLRDKVIEAQAEADKATGALERVTVELLDEFGCQSLVEAKKLLKKLEKQETAAEREYAAALDQFKTNWDAYLENRDGDEDEEEDEATEADRADDEADQAQ